MTAVQAILAERQTMFQFRPIDADRAEFQVAIQERDPQIVTVDVPRKLIGCSCREFHNSPSRTVREGTKCWQPFRHRPICKHVAAVQERLRKEAKNG